MKVSHSTQTAILQLVDPACAAAQEHIETRIWNFHFLSFFSAKLWLRRVEAVVTGGGNIAILIFRLEILLMKRILEHTYIPVTTHLGLPNLCINSSESLAWLTDMKLINEMFNRL